MHHGFFSPANSFRAEKKKKKKRIFLQKHSVIQVQMTQQEGSFQSDRLSEKANLCEPRYIHTDLCWVLIKNAYEKDNQVYINRNSSYLFAALHIR